MSVKESSSGTKENKKTRTKNLLLRPISSIIKGTDVTIYDPPLSERSERNRVPLKSEGIGLFNFLETMAK